jgi:hypothetical protein
MPAAERRERAARPGVDARAARRSRVEVFVACQRRAAAAPQLHLAHPVQRRGGAEVRRVLRPRHPGGLRAPDGRRDRLRQRAERPPLAGAERALAKARRRAGGDPEFVSLPARRRARTLQRLPRSRADAVSDDAWSEAGWTIVDGALRTFLHSSRLASWPAATKGCALGLILGGDVTILQERIAIVSTHMPPCRPTSRR